MRYNPARKEVILKVVYYGPGLAGKTSNLQYLCARAPAGQASELISVDTHSERTLQFDFLATELGIIQGYAVRLDFYTVPGQSYYAGTRRQILTGADAVVFVADSRREALDENIDAMNEMLNNLRHHRLPEDLPIVLQYNKQDLPTAVAPEQLQPLMNVRNWPSFGAVAITGEGVSETCEALVRQLIDQVEQTDLPVIIASDSPTTPTPTPLPAAPTSWLITCFRCQSMLEVPSAGIGEIYTCGVCQTQVQVIDPERGQTGLPQNAPRPITGIHSPPRAVEDEYRANDASGTGSGGVHALKVTPIQPSRSGYIVPATDFPLDGFAVLNLLDENAQGRRLRVREVANGKVYRALVLAPALLAQPGYFDSVEPYTRMTGPVQHPNLLHLASFRQNGEALIFLSTDPVDYEPLSHVLSRRRALAPPHAIGIIRQLALALEEGARHGAIHGWLRPDVVLVAPDGNVLLDELCIPPNPRFLIRELAGASAATEYYLAPEYLNDEVRGDVRGDIFLLGALLFRMITGEGLVTGYNAMEALHKLAANGPRLLRDAQQGISRELNNFYLKLVAVDRSQRFQTYGELLDGIDRFGGGAKRQNLQLTAAQQHNPSVTGGMTRPGGAQTGRRGGTGPLPPAPPRTRSGRDPSGGHAVLPSRRVPPANGNGPLVILVIVMVILATAVVYMIFLQPQHGRTVTDAQSPSTTVPETLTARPELPVAPRIELPLPTKNPHVPSSLAPADSVPAVSSAQTRLEIRRIIADQLVAEQYSGALKTCERLTDPIDKQESQVLVLSKHESRKLDIERLLTSGVDPAVIRKELEPARTSWGFPGDLEWAVAVQSKADALALANSAPAAVAPAENQGALGEFGPTRPAPWVVTSTKVDDPSNAAKPLAPKSTAPTAQILPTVDAAATAYGAVVRALSANQLPQAQAVIAALEIGSPTTRALRQLSEWWPGRAQFLNRIAATKVIKLRFNHPTTNEVVDVVSADATGVTVMSAAGSSSNVTWGQIPPKSLAKLFMDATLTPGASSDELASGAAVQFIAEEPLQAGLIAKRAKAVLGERTASIETLIDLAARRNVVGLLNKGFDAVRSDNTKAAAEVNAELRKLDKNLLKPYEADLERLNRLLTQATVGLPPVSTAPTLEPKGPNQLPRDIKERQAALRTLGWEPVGDAWLDGTQVRLAPNSGISFELSRNIAGFSINAQGAGYLRLIPTRGAAGAAVKGGVPLPLSAELTNSFTVNFSRDAMVVLDSRGMVIQSLPLSAPPTIFLIISTAEATLITVPKPNTL